MPKGIHNNHKSWNKGKKGVYSRKTLKEMREAKLKNPPKNLFKSGKEHPFWNGGSSFKTERIRLWKTAEYKLWRLAVFERDNYQCIWGGKEHGNKLNADHIKPWRDYPELRFAIDNGRTLCVECHKKTDTYGRTRKKLE